MLIMTNNNKKMMNSKGQARNFPFAVVEINGKEKKVFIFHNEEN